MIVRTVLRPLDGRISLLLTKVLPNLSYVTRALTVNVVRVGLSLWRALSMWVLLATAVLGMTGFVSPVYLGKCSVTSVYVIELSRIQCVALKVLSESRQQLVMQPVTLIRGRLGVGDLVEWRLRSFTVSSDCGRLCGSCDVLVIGDWMWLGPR